MTKATTDNDLPTFPTIERGVYRHYKGNLYQVEGVCVHSETLEPFVLYSPLYETKVKTWIRPYDMFVGYLEINGKQTPRFEKVEDHSEV